MKGICYKGLCRILQLSWALDRSCRCFTDVYSLLWAFAVRLWSVMVLCGVCGLALLSTVLFSIHRVGYLDCSVQDILDDCVESGVDYEARGGRMWWGIVGRPLRNHLMRAIVVPYWLPSLFAGSPLANSIGILASFIILCVCRQTAI